MQIDVYEEEHASYRLIMRRITGKNDSGFRRFDL
jgi:hypothetical protein